ncbi:probable rhamnogalacturonate lyase B isoform X2 [Solanum dulcamara]|uniref:probable rhamnogalacturonate lyase B isoform X2 n=1 Tax=Solanum dulcamara TaxID=45834 RepID=UPI002485F094|nr:probable rhamnogalacturonate lyase B isoform X2 [Solanum dulcamara]
MKKKEWSFVLGLLGILLQLFLLAESTLTRQNVFKKNSQLDQQSFPPVQLLTLDDYVVVDNGLFNITFSVPGGMVTEIQYNGIDNLLEDGNKDDNRGYWDIVWNKPSEKGIFDKLHATDFKVIMEDENQVELSFTRTWDSLNSKQLSMNIDKRFQYMAISDERQRIMPTAHDREMGQILDYSEAVLLTNPNNPFIKGEVDDKYQYSCENKDNRVHGWISPTPRTGFWMITPTDEFRTGGPVKQDLTSHTGPVNLNMFFSTHYAGEVLGLKFRDGEPWKKVFGPVFVYINSLSPDEQDTLTLWADAKEQMFIETENWPYSFPLSEDFARADQRGIVSGRLLVRDSYVSQSLIIANSAFIGLAAPGNVGSWQLENKAYQFWTQTDSEGYFLIKNVIPGNYSLYAWVPGFVGDYMYDPYIIVTPGSRKRVETLIYDAPRNGPTLWEIGIPDRTGAEFFIPDAQPGLLNKLYVVNNQERFRQYGLWDRYTEIYPDDDLVFTVGLSSYQTDWFFAHLNRYFYNDDGNKTYAPTTWQVLFDLEDVDQSSNYTLQLALASAHEAELQVRFNDPETDAPHYTTGLIGKDNAIARHGIHGIYRLYTINVPGSLLGIETNIMYLTQSRGDKPFRGIIYDYIRLEGPSYESN